MLAAYGTIPLILNQTKLMNRATAGTLQDNNCYDNCLINACLKKLFTGTAKTRAAAPTYIVARQVAEVRKELELLNKTNIPELTYDYLLGMEQSLPDVGTRYVVVYRENAPVLFAWFQVFTLTSKNFNFKSDKGFVKGVLRFFLDLKKAKVIIAGNALRNETSCCCYDTTALGDDAATEIIASVGEQVADEEHATALVLKDMPVTPGSLKMLADMGYSAPYADNVMNMALAPEWTSLADYVAALSRKYKTRANKILALREGLVLVQLTEEQLKHYLPRINQLFQSVSNSQAFSLPIPGNGHFTDLKQLYGDAFEVYGFFEEGELVAFYTAFVTEAAYELYYAGFNYELNNDHQLYFNILFAGLERAIALGKQQLKLGRTSFDAKASLGAKPGALSYYAKTANIPAVGSKWFVNYFTAMEDGKWRVRNPLK